MTNSINILGLDPGLTFAWARIILDSHSLALVSYGCQRYPGNPRGNAGRELVTLWAVGLLKQFATSDEVASDNELAGAGLSTNVPALGAFDAAREFAREHGRRVQGRKVFGEYPRWVYVNQCAALAGVFTPSGLTRWKGDMREYRAVLAQLTGCGLQDTRGERRHCLDAIACGICHAHRIHGWTPRGYRRPARKPLVGQAFIDRLDRIREEATQC